MSANRDGTPWHDPAADTGPATLNDQLAPRTQLVPDRDAYLGQGSRDVGRRIADDQVELFAATDPVTALDLELRQHQPLFLALHDLGASASLRLLASVAQAAGSPLQRLTIRRQGHGDALATVPFIEVQLADGKPLRCYTTDVAGDTTLRQSMARTLLHHASLGVLLVGPQAPEVLMPQAQALLAAQPQQSRLQAELLLLPLTAGTALAGLASLLQGGGSTVHVAPPAAKTRQAWSQMAQVWNRLQGGLGGSAPLPVAFNGEAEATPANAAATPSPAAPARTAVDDSDAPTLPMGLNPMRARAAAAAAPTGNLWQVYADSCALLKGALAACAFDPLGGHALAHAGRGAEPAQLAEQGAALLRTMTDAARALGLGAAPSDGSLSVGHHHLLVRPVPGHPGVALALLLSDSTNLTLAKLQLERVQAPR